MANKPRLKTLFEEKVRPQLMEQFGYTNIWEAPRLQKVCVSMAVSEATENFEALENAINELSLIVGQRPCITRAKRSIAAFGVRQGQAIGCKTTLRRGRMWELLDRLFNVAIPRIRDFRGLSPSSFDGRGNYSVGVTEQTVFPEVDADKVEMVRGLDITFVTSARTDEGAKALLTGLGFPFRAQ